MNDSVKEDGLIIARSDGGTGEIVTFGPFRLIPAERLLMKGDKSVNVGGRAFDLLCTLVRNAGRVMSKRDLINRVWPDVIVEETNLRVLMARLRKTIGDGVGEARYITNVPGRGYCFVAPVQRLSASQDHAFSKSVTGAKLPARPHTIGREKHVATLTSLLGSHRFVSIVGPGGMGKTTVALAISHAIAEDFDGAICFV